MKSLFIIIMALFPLHAFAECGDLDKSSVGCMVHYFIPTDYGPIIPRSGIHYTGFITKVVPTGFEIKWYDYGKGEKGEVDELTLEQMPLRNPVPKDAPYLGFEDRDSLPPVGTEMVFSRGGTGYEIYSTVEAKFTDHYVLIYIYKENRSLSYRGYDYRHGSKIPLRYYTRDAY